MNIFIENIIKNKYTSMALGVIFILPGIIFSLSSGMSCSDNPDIFSADWHGHIFIIGMNVAEILGILLLLNGLIRKSAPPKQSDTARILPSLPKISRPTSMFWICLTIFICSLFIGLCIYQANRYTTYMGVIIDKYNGTKTIPKMVIKE